MSSLIGKALDKISVQHQCIATPSRIPLQFGFTNKRSRTFTAFPLNEANTEVKDLNMPLLAASLDVQKAFGIIRHQSLLYKLYQQGPKGCWGGMEGRLI